jgi:DNA polymerase I
VITLDNFKRIWSFDFEFRHENGEIPIPVCYTAKELYSGEVIMEWLDGVDNPTPKYPMGSEDLFLAFYSSAEYGCHIALKWSRPCYLIDLFVEFRNITNGNFVPGGNNLIGVCNYLGLPSDQVRKDLMRKRILEGPPYSDEEKEQILTYCLSDVECGIGIFDKIKDRIDVQHALLRGRYMYGVAVMENYGIPIDTESYDLLKLNWDKIKNTLIERVDKDYDVYVFNSKTGQYNFNIEKFGKFLSKHNIPWDVTKVSGALRTDDEFMKEQSKAFPLLQPLRELNYAKNKLKLNDLRVGKDGRNRAMLSAFSSITGRNQPSSSGYIFGNAKFIRNLIKPRPGEALGYLDYEQQEIGVAAALSGDKNLIKAYKSGDPYIEFAVLAGAVPPGSTKQTHPHIREQFKVCMLGVNYGMTEVSFSKKANISVLKAKEILQLHTNIFQDYWDWVNDYMDSGKLSGRVTTKFGWGYNVPVIDFHSKECNANGKRKSYRTLQNFPMQGNGSDILRLAVSLCVENGIRVIAPVHDALLVEAPISDIENMVLKASSIMTKASEYVIKFPLRVEAEIIKYPNHFTDERGDVMWNKIWGIINEQK